MENVDAMVDEQIGLDIQAIKSEREAYLAEYIEANLGMSCMCGMRLSRDFKCNTCEAEFETLPMDAKHCPTCLSTNIRSISRDEVTIHRRVVDSIIDGTDAKIKELCAQGLSKRAIAEKLGTSVDHVSSVVGVKKRKLPQETIDFIRREYLMGNQEIKSYLGRISEERIREVTGDLCQEIKRAYDQGTPIEDIGKLIGIEGHDQAILDIVNRFSKNKWMFGLEGIDWS